MIWPGHAKRRTRLTPWGPSDNGSRKCKWPHRKPLTNDPIELIFKYVVALDEGSLSLEFQISKVTPARFMP